MKKFKCAIIGDAEVGKTSLIRSHFRGGFHTHYIPTYLEKYIVQVSDKNGPKYEIEFWDAGEKKKNFTIVNFIFSKKKKKDIQKIF